jgi:hypothetical protein
MLVINQNFELKNDYVKPFQSEMLELKVKLELIYVKVLGLFEYENGVVITEELVKAGNLWIVNHELSIENLPYANKLKVSLVLFNDGLQKTTNKVDLLVNTKVIEKTIKKYHSNVIKDLAIRFAKLENIIENINKKGLLDQRIVINKDSIKPGMIPVATINGEFTASYPFFDFVKTINNVAAVNEHIELTLKDLVLSDKTTNAEKVVQLLLQVVKEQAGVLQEVLVTQQTLADKIKDLELKLAEHINTALF